MIQMIQIQIDFHELNSLGQHGSRCVRRIQTLSRGEWIRVPRSDG